eukprot:m.831623 g.831623  ORF g.831623 m.831623 type:complete len:720 (+) comp59456_c0_seq40:1439-3598(+)
MSDVQTVASYSESVIEVYFIGALISLLCDALVATIYAADKRSRRHPAGLFVLRVACSVLLDIVFIAAYITSAPAHPEPTTSCIALAFITQFASFAGDLWYLTLSIDLYIAMRHPFSFHQEYLPRYHVVVWVLSLVSALIPISALQNRYGTDVNEVCWIRDNSHSGATSFSFYHIGLYYIPLVLIVLFSVYVVIVTNRAFGGGLPDTQATRTRVLRQSGTYVKIISSYLMLHLTLWIAQVGYTATHEDTNVGLVYCFAVVRSLRGIVDLFAWTVNNRGIISAKCSCLGRLFDCCSPARKARSHSIELTSPFISDPVDPATARRSMAAPFELPNIPAETINRALRREIMICTTWGISDSMQHAITAHANVAMAETELTRTERSVSMTAQGTDTHTAVPVEVPGIPDPRPPPQKRALQSITRRIHLPLNLSHKSFEFMDYDALLFEEIRRLARIDEQAYLRSFTVNSDGDYGSMLEKFTEGRSGSFFYFTHDYKYIVKTVTAAECQLLQTILPQYVAYLRSSPTSFLTRFLGLHAIRMSPEQAKISFVVMGNIFAVGQNVGTVRLDEIYDLKGSVVHRRSLKNGMTPKSFKGTMKDMDLARKLRVGPAQATTVKQQITNDVTFLRHVNIMDYSLLVGIHDCTEDLCTHGPLVGGIRGVGEEMGSVAYYYLGIIDMLQLYNLNKMMEHHFKSKIRLMDKHGISAVNTEFYATRFLQRILEHFE